MSPAALRDRYQQYLACLNDRRLDDLGNFVHDELSYNGRSMTCRHYAEMLAGDITAIPDLVFTPELLVVDDDHVACRLFFRCTPEREFLGIAPTGAEVAFAEHVFYRFREGRIEQVWSLLDTAALDQQLAG
jgi:predicted ester cyclase